MKDINPSGNINDWCPVSDRAIALQKDANRIKAIRNAGYLGVMPDGSLVDRREHPEAIAMQENSLLGCPEPKEVG